MKKNREQSLFDMDELIQQYMKDNLERLTQDDPSKKNNSFVYLENDTIQLLILYLFMRMEKGDKRAGNEYIEEEVSQLLDTANNVNRQSFEDVLELLKNRSKGNSSDE